MKVKCPLISSEGCTMDARFCDGSEDCFVNVEIPTSELIAEIERRSPCKKCVSWLTNSTPCMTCLWKSLRIFGKDNFKEAK